MRTDLQLRIERYLLSCRGWVKASELERLFDIRERQLRQLGKKPGLVTKFAISLSDKGFKHIALATTTEWIHARNAERRAAIARLRRIKDWTASRSEVTRSILHPPMTFERDSNQAVMPEVLKQS
ncbi:MAG: hypothetical protein V2A34_02610 [Lentisphaerota bacterium]